MPIHSTFLSHLIFWGLKRHIFLLIILGLIQAHSSPCFSQFNGAGVKSSQLWNTNRIPVCWENSGGFAIQRQWVKTTIENTWERESNLDFYGWGECSCQINCDGIRIRIKDSHPHTKGLGFGLNGKVDGMVLNFQFSQWGSQFASNKEHNIKAIAIHEFGHAIGLAHEQNRSDCNFPNCLNESQGSNSDFLVTPCDLFSVMNYCNPNYNNNGQLSFWDKLAVKLLYGPFIPSGSRLILTNNNKQAFAVDGNSKAKYFHFMDRVSDISMSGNRIGIVTTDGKAYSKEGNLTAQWVLQMENAKQIKLSGDRIGVLTADQKVYIKEGKQEAGWTLVATNAKEFTMSQGRIGFIDNAMVARVKAGAINAGWVEVANNVSKLALSGKRIGIINHNKEAYVKDGSLEAGWVKLFDNTEHLVLKGRRIGVLNNRNQLFVKEGDISAGWTLVADQVRTYLLDEQSILIRNIHNQLFLKDGKVGASWILISDDIHSFHFRKSHSSVGD